MPFSLLVSVLIGLLICSAFLYVLDVYATTALDRYLLEHYGPELYKRYTSEYDAAGNGFTSGGNVDLTEANDVIGGGGGGHGGSGTGGGDSSVQQQLLQQQHQLLQRHLNYVGGGGVARRFFGHRVESLGGRVWTAISDAWQKYSGSGDEAEKRK